MIYNCMSFYLVGKSLDCKLNNWQNPIFIKSLSVGNRKEILILINRAGNIIAIDINTRQIVDEKILSYKNQRLSNILSIKHCQHVLSILTFKDIFLLDLSNIFDLFNQKTKENSINVENIKIYYKQREITDSFRSITNKDIKLIKQRGKICLKIIGRNEKTVTYMFGTLNLKDYILNANILYNHPYDYEFSLSLQTLSFDFIAYKSYISKNKPLTVYITEFPFYSQSSSDSKEIVQEASICTLCEQLTILCIFKLNDSTLCLIGNNQFQSDKTSLMIVYNMQQKYTMNLVEMKGVTLTKSIFFSQPNFKFNFQGCRTYFDVFQQKQAYSVCWQIFPHSCKPTQKQMLRGKVISSDEDYILNKVGNELVIFPKIHKRTIYFKWLSILVPADKSFHELIAGLLQ